MYLSIHLSICLSIFLSIYPSIHLSIYPSIHLSIYLCIYLSIDRSIYLSIYLTLSSFYLSIYLSFYLSLSLSLICLPIYLSISFSLSLSVCLSVYLPVFLQAWKRSYSARLPQFLNLTPSRTKQCCETSMFELDNVKNEAILRDFLQKWKVACSADGLVPMRFAIFPVHLSKLLRLPRKNDARSYEMLHLSRKIISANLKIWCSKMQTLSGNQRPDLLTALMNMSLVLRLPRKMHLCRSASNVPRLPSFLEMLQNPHVLLTFDKVHNPLRLPRKNVWCFVHFGFDMCFAPQGRALFRHRNFQKCSEPVSFLHFWLRNVLCATTACAFSTSQLLKVLRSWSVLYFAPQRRAICHLSSGQLAPHSPL